MYNASFPPWSLLYVHGRCDVYRGLRDSFQSYYLDQVSEWRQRAGLGLFSTNSSPNKLQPAVVSLQSEVVSGVIASVGHERSLGDVQYCNAVPVHSSIATPNSASDVAKKCNENKDAHSDSAPVRSSGKGNSRG